jgi:hypothetical protein
MKQNVSKFNKFFAVPLVNVAGFLRLPAAVSVAWRTKMVDGRPTRNPTKSEIARREARDAKLAAAFARFERIYLANAKPLTPEQRRIIDTPLGCSPK